MQVRFLPAALGNLSLWCSTAAFLVSTQAVPVRIRVATYTGFGLRTAKRNVAGSNPVR